MAKSVLCRVILRTVPKLKFTVLVLCSEVIFYDLLLLNLASDACKLIVNLYNLGMPYVDNSCSIQLSLISKYHLPASSKIPYSIHAAVEPGHNKISRCEVKSEILYSGRIKSNLGPTKKIPAYTVSSRVYAQSISIQNKMKVGVGIVAIHVLHWVTTDLKMTFGPDMGMHAVQNWAYRRENTVINVWPYHVCLYSVFLYMYGWYSSCRKETGWKAGTLI